MTNKRHKQKTAEEFLQRLISADLLSWDEILGNSRSMRSGSLRTGKALVRDLIQRDLGHVFLLRSAPNDPGVVVKSIATSKISESNVRHLGGLVHVHALSHRFQEHGQVVFPVQVTLIVGFSATVTVVKSLDDAIALQLMTLLRQVGRDKLLTCECGTPFVKIKRQQFCSERCQNRVFMRKKRAEEANGLEVGRGSKR